MGELASRVALQEDGYFQYDHPAETVIWLSSTGRACECDSRGSRQRSVSTACLVPSIPGLATGFAVILSNGYLNGYLSPCMARNALHP